MSGDRIKRAAQWFYQNIFRDEPIGNKVPPVPPREPTRSILTPRLRAARSLEQGVSGSYHSREVIFLQQAKLLSDYEDDFPFEGHVQYYYPTYQSLTDRELRGYFSWRTRLRRGEVPAAPMSFVCIHIYELLNQIGVTDPMDGYRKLCFLREQFGAMEERLLPYLNRWIPDYVVYYNLDANLLAGLPQVVRDRSITVLEQVHHQDTAKVICAVKTLAPKWLGRSKFYRAHTQDMDKLIQRVLMAVSDHYDHCQKPMIEQYFGPQVQRQVDMFGGAVFANYIRRSNYEYVLDERCIYRCRGGFWTVERHDPLRHSGSELEALMKTIDALLREAYSDRNQIKCELDTKWLLRAIGKEIGILQKEKAAAEAAETAEAAKNTVTIDFSRLEQIRQAAAITRDKLIVEEETEPEPEPVPEPAPEELPADTPLSGAEYRLLQCLLYGGDTGWVQREGYLRSVLTDSINEKLYDTFFDTVLEESGPVEDYIDDLKGMIRP